MNESSNTDGPALHHDHDPDRIDEDMLDDEDHHHIHQGGEVNVNVNVNVNGGVVGFLLELINDLWTSSGVVLNNKLNWLLIMGPIALLGDALGFLGETWCFAFSGLALIPCAER